MIRATQPSLAERHPSRRAHLERRKLWRKQLRDLGLCRDLAEFYSTGERRFRKKLAELTGKAEK